MGRLDVALRTGEFRVRAVADKPGGRMVELPVSKTVRIVAGRAVLTQGAFMVIIAAVAGDALRRGTPVATVRVALLAAHSRMQPHQGESGQVVIEPDLITPSGFAVTGGTVATHAAGMDIIGLVTAEALLGQFLVLRAGRMADMTGQLGMLPVQRIPMLARMVIHHGLPTRRTMAIRAVFTEPAGVGIFGGMTPVTGLGQLGLEIAVLVTGIAGDLVVPALEPEPRLLEMIESGVFPGHGRMAVPASRTASTAMDVIRCMAGIAARRRPLEGAIPMATCAGCLGVGSGQGEAGLVMIESGWLEGSRVVALATVRSQLPAVDIVRAVTVDTSVRSITMLFSCLVAGDTDNSLVGTFELEIHPVVTEGIGLQTHDIGRAALVLPMAARTARIVGKCPTVVSGARLQIRSDFLVAVETQAAHLRLVGAIVAE